MGVTKQLWMEEQSRGYPYTDKFICSRCLFDYDLRLLVKSDGEKGVCSFCENKTRKVISFDFILERFLSSISEYYEDPDTLGIPWSSDEDGWQNSVIEIEELLEEIPTISENESVIKEICDIFSQRQWCKVNDYYPSMSRDLEYSWETFEYNVKHKRRFTFQKIRRDFGNESLFNNMMKSMKLIFTESNIIKKIPPETVIYRARNSDVMINDAKELGSPPYEKAKYSNRMSPEGISMFYGAFDRRTCIKEIVDITNVKKGITIGKFTNLEELHLLDFTELPEIPGFFSDNQYTREAILFLKTFSQKISKPIQKDELEHIEYIPTQVFTEYIRYEIRINNRNIDGIIYNSSKNQGKCVVLFFDNSECISITDSKKSGRLLVLNSTEFIDVI
jgi:hypothetical protein